MIKEINDVILPEISDSMPLFGGVSDSPFIDVRPDAVWPLLKTKELQIGLYFDTWNCVAESAVKSLQFFMKYLLDAGLIPLADLTWLTEKGYLVDGEVNFNARIIGAVAGTVIGRGNDYLTVANTICEIGLIPEALYAFDLRDRDPKKNDPKIYYQTPPQELIDLGKEFIKRFKIYSEPVYQTGWADAAKQSALQVFVNAWYMDKADGLYYNPTGRTNHAVVKVKPTVKQISDTYEPFEKGLKDDYIYHPYAIKYAIWPQKATKPMQLQKYQTYLLVDGNEQKYALADMDGLLVADPGKEIFVQLMSASRLGGLDKVKVISVTLADWNSVNRYNLKKQKIWDAKTQTSLN